MKTTKTEQTTLRLEAAARALQSAAEVSACLEHYPTVDVPCAAARMCEHQEHSLKGF